jgi:hypothetical protein
MTGMVTFTAPRSGWYRFTPDKDEPEYLGDGPGQSIASASELVTLLAEGETVGFGNSGGAQMITAGDWVTIPWDHE